MNYDYLEMVCHRLNEIMVSLYRVDYAVSFGGIFVYLVGWYILYQMYRLWFLKLLIAGDLLYTLQFIFVNRHHFFGYPEEPPSFETMTLLMAVETLLSLASILLQTAGACFGVRYLQRKWADWDKKGEPPG
jgi:hypothetical protein